MNNNNNITEKEFLESYDASKYDRPSVTVDMLVFTVTNESTDNYRRLPEKALKLLLIKRGVHPFIGQWALPGGFVKMDESLDDAAYRELKEETGISNLYLEQLFTWGEVDRDPRTRVISTSYLSLVDSSLLNPKAGDDADDTAWFDVACKLSQEQKIITEKGYQLFRYYTLNLSNENETISSVIKVEKIIEGRSITTKSEVVESDGIAFDHAKIIQYALERLRNKIEYTDIAFHFMPELFTLTELQQVYETILNTELLKANFRRKISDMVIETNESTKDAGHRPSKLFRFNPNWNQEN